MFYGGHFQTELWPKQSKVFILQICKQPSKHPCQNHDPRLSGKGTTLGTYVHLFSVSDFLCGLDKLLLQRLFLAMHLHSVWQRPYSDLGPQVTPWVCKLYHQSIWNETPHWVEVRSQPVAWQAHGVRKRWKQRTGKCKQRMGRYGGRDYSKSFAVHDDDNQRVMVAPNSVNSQKTPDAVKVLWTQDQVCTVAAAQLRSSAPRCSSPGLSSGIQSILFRREASLYVNPKTYVLTQTFAYFDECRVSNVI